MGYDPYFLGDDLKVPLPTLGQVAQAEAWDHGRLVEHPHFTLAMHAHRRMALFTAHNIDGAQLVSVSSGSSWRLDDAVPDELQAGPEVYVDNPWDRGHLVRRAAVLWGTVAEAREANRATYVYTNAAPQHQNFNRDEWVHLEDWVLDLAEDDCYRVAVFTGPVFREDDVAYRGIRIPGGYWKVVVRRAPEGQAAYTCFMMKQSEFWQDLRGRRLLDLTVYQLPVAELEALTGLVFADGVPVAAEPVKAAMAEVQSLPGLDVTAAPWPIVRGRRDLVL